MMHLPGEGLGEHCQGRVYFSSVSDVQMVIVRPGVFSKCVYPGLA